MLRPIEKLREKWRRNSNQLPSRARRLVGAAKRRSEKKRLQFSLTVEDILPLLEAGVCQVTGIEFVFEAGKGTNPYSPTIDRIDSSRGYVRGNVQVVIHMYNACKNEWSEEAVLEFARRLVERATGPISSSQNRTRPHALGPATTFRA